MKNRIRELRENYKISQAELGDIIGVSQQTISRAESGNMASDILCKISDYFQVSTDYLLYRSEFPFSNRLNHENIDPFMNENSIIIANLMCLNEDGLSLAKSLIGDLSKTELLKK